MNQRDMYRLIGAAEAQGFTVKVIRKGQVVTFTNWGVRNNGRLVTLVAIITIDTEFANAVDRLRRIGLLWLLRE